MSGHAPRKKRSSALLEGSSAKLVKTARKERAKSIAGKAATRALALRAPGLKKSFHYKPGTILRRKLKNDHDLVLEQTPFRLTVREITGELHSECKWQAGALEVLQKVAEDDLVRTLHGAQLAAHHDKRVKINKRDMDLIKLMRTMFRANYDSWTSKYGSDE